MIRFFLDRIREASGPLKQLRLLACDILEEFIDTAEHYSKLHLKKCKDQNTDQEVSMHTQQTQDTSRLSKTKDFCVDCLNFSSQNVSLTFDEAILVPANKKKQEFKALAILWDVHHKGKGALSANDLTNYGLSIGLSIRHENLRKVIRMQLSDYVNRIVNDKSGVGISSLYEINNKGIAYFEKKYLNRTTTG